MAYNLQGPYLRTPLAHFTGAGGHNLQKGGVCAHIELNLMECMEAYGYDKGLKYCQGYLEDFNECRFKFKQIRRRDAIEKERLKKYKEGKIDSQFVPAPPANAY